MIKKALFCVVCVLLSSLAMAKEPEFSHERIFKLKKDEKAYVFITEKATQIKETFEFSWTLYDGLNLVVHSKLRKYPRQIMLSTRRALNLYSQSVLFTRQNPYTDEVRVYLEFIKFEKNKAHIKALVRDLKKRVDIEYYPLELNDENNENNATNGA